MISVTTFAAPANKLGGVKVTSVSEAGHPATQTQMHGSCVGENENGEQIFYGVAKGSPSIFFAYNLHTKEMEFQADLPYDSCAVDISPVDQRIYVAAHSVFYIYDPKIKKLTGYGSIFGETAVMDHGSFDSEGNYYFGTFPNACLVRYNIKKDVLENLGSHMVQGNYVRSVVVCGDNVYMGNLSVPAQIGVYNIRTRRTKDLPMPELGDVLTAAPSSVYTMSTLGKYFVAKIKFQNYFCCIYDSELEEWIDYVPATSHLHWAGPYENEQGEEIAYYGGYDSNIRSYNFQTKEIKDYPTLKLEGAKYVINPKLVEMKDQEKYPGKSLIFGTTEAGYAVANFETGRMEYNLPEEFPSIPTQVSRMIAGNPNEIVCGVMQGSFASVFDIQQGKTVKKAPTSQIESLDFIDGKYYFGMYGTARLLEYDSAWEAPVEAGNMAKEHQDRCFNIADADDKIIWGSIPYYGYLGGCIGVYDKKTKGYKVYDRPVQNHSITGLAYRDGKIYASTGIYGGLGIDPVPDLAKMFIMDIETGEVELIKDVIFSTDKAPQYMAGKMTFSPDGRLFMGGNNVLAELNPEDLSIIKEMRIGSQADQVLQMTSLWEGNELVWAPNGLLLTNTGKKLTAVDIDTYETKTLISDMQIGCFTIASDDNVYFLSKDTTVLWKAEISGLEGERKDKIVNASVILKVNSPYASCYGARKMLDESNKEVKAVVRDGRTLVPVRFLAENYGAKVSYNETTHAVFIQYNEKTCQIKLNDTQMMIDGEPFALDVPADTIEDRTMLPLRVVAENILGKTVHYDEGNELIVLSNSALIQASDESCLSEIAEDF